MLLLALITPYIVVFSNIRIFDFNIRCIVVVFATYCGHMCDVESTHVNLHMHDAGLIKIYTMNYYRLLCIYKYQQEFITVYLAPL